MMFNKLLIMSEIIFKIGFFSLEKLVFFRQRGKILSFLFKVF